MRDFSRSRFDDQLDAETGLELPNLADLMLVFVTGLIAALAASTGALVERRVIDEDQLGRELPSLPTSANETGDGLEAVGRVFKDPKTGKLYVVE
ncbi:MAG: hypothetical protein AAF648_02660 [Pseudomonadota bacterium]